MLMKRNVENFHKVLEASALEIVTRFSSKSSPKTVRKYTTKKFVLISFASCFLFFKTDNKSAKGAFSPCQEKKPITVIIMKVN